MHTSSSRVSRDASALRIFSISISSWDGLAVEGPAVAEEVDIVLVGGDWWTSTDGVTRRRGWFG